MSWQCRGDVVTLQLLCRGSNLVSQHCLNITKPEVATLPFDFATFLDLLFLSVDVATLLTRCRDIELMF